jgi:hypothetical protein
MDRQAALQFPGKTQTTIMGVEASNTIDRFIISCSDRMWTVYT